MNAWLLLEERMIKAATGLTSAGQVYNFDGLPVMVSSESLEVSSAVGRIMGARSLVRLASDSLLDVSGNLDDTGWQIRADGGFAHVLPTSTVAPSVAADLVATACAAAAQRQGSILIRGAVLERDGVGLAIIGDDDSVKTLAFHLHARRWTAISFGYSFLNASTLVIAGLQALAAVSSATIDRIPRRYRRAIEASKWYDSGAYLTFYAVDPTLTSNDHASSTTLHSVVIVNGSIESGNTIHDTVVTTDEVCFVPHPMAASIRVGKMALGSPITSCDALERWFLNSSRME